MVAIVRRLEMPIKRPFVEADLSHDLVMLQGLILAYKEKFGVENNDARRAIHIDYNALSGDQCKLAEAVGKGKGVYRATYRPHSSEPTYSFEVFIEHGVCIKLVMLYSYTVLI